MKHWFTRNYKALIITAFLIPIITVAIVSISHVTMWYGLSNPVSWSMYLSIGIEIAALSALAAISANMGSKVYFPFIVVTVIQFIGNIFFAYSFIDVTTKTFVDWVDLVSPLLEFIGIESDDYVSHKRVLALFAGGMLPIISLSFLHMLVKFTEEDRVNEEKLVETEHKNLVDKHIIEEEIEKYKKEHEHIQASDLVSEISRIRLSENDLELLEKVLNNPPPPNENLKEAYKHYQEKVNNGEIYVEPSTPSVTPTITSTPHVEEVKDENSEIEDIEYIQKKLLDALRTPEVKEDNNSIESSDDDINIDQHTDDVITDSDQNTEELIDENDVSQVNDDTEKKN